MADSHASSASKPSPTARSTVLMQEAECPPFSQRLSQRLETAKSLRKTSPLPAQAHQLLGSSTPECRRRQRLRLSKLAYKAMSSRPIISNNRRQHSAQDRHEIPQNLPRPICRGIILALPRACPFCSGCKSAFTRPFRFLAPAVFLHLGTRLCIPPSLIHLSA